MSSYRKQGGLLRGLLDESQQQPCLGPNEQHDEELGAEDPSIRSSFDQRASPHGSLFSMEVPAPSSSVVGRSYLRAPSVQGPWGVDPPSQLAGSATPPLRIPSSCSSASTHPHPHPHHTHTHPTDASRLTTIGFSLASSLPRLSGVSPPAVATQLQQQQQQQQQGRRSFSRQDGQGLTERLLRQESVSLSPRAAWARLHGSPPPQAGLVAQPLGAAASQQQQQQQQQEQGQRGNKKEEWQQQQQQQQQPQPQPQPLQQQAQQEGAAQQSGAVGAVPSMKGVGPQAAAARVVEPPPETVDGGNLKAVVFGMINGAVGLPALIAFTAIVFQAPVYAPQLGSLCKMLFFSSAIHQLVFCVRSTLPFAIGQVQDVGLIFLSAMASSIAAMCAEAGLPAQTALGTTLLTLSIATTVVGVCTVLVGRYRLAQLVQYVPLPVVGGYLGYVGYFCVAGGTALGTSTTIDTLYSWTNLLTMDCLIKIVPTVGTSLLLITTLEYCTHPLALPSALLSVPLLFHIVLATSGYSLKDAQDHGWVMKPPAEGEMQYFWQLWDMFNLRQHGLGGIYLPALWAQGPKLAGLFLVVCFGSCMDVAAIQQDMPQPLDFNRELVTVGLSNVCVGVIGAGYTGSYIFSQTIFTMRAGVYNRLCGLVVAVMEVIVFALPFSVVEYCPSFFFGALLLWFGTEICRDWLVLSHRKLSMAEYALLWSTFALIMAMGLEAGIAAGIVASTLYFAYEYARSQVAALHQIAASSGTAHGYEAARLLDLMAARHVALSVSGYVFFGSSLALSARVEEVADKLLRDVSELEAAADSALAQHHAGLLLATEGKHAPLLPPDRLPPVLRTSHYAASTPPPVQPEQLGPPAAVDEDGYPLPPSLAWADAVKAMSDASLYVILDCRHVTHVDATGARTFGSLNSSLGARGVRLLFAGLSPKAGAVRKLLSAHGVQLRAGPEVVIADLGTAAAAAAFHHEQQRQQQQTGENWCWEFRSLAAAVAHVERSYLAAALARGLLPAPAPKVGLQEVLSTHADELPLPPAEVAYLVSSLAPYFHSRQLMSGEVLLQAGQNVEELILIEEGFLQLHLGHAGSSAAAPGSPRRRDGSTQAQHQQGRGFGYPSSIHEPDGSKEVHVRTSQYGPGCFVAAHEFFLRRPAAATAVAVATPTTAPTATAATTQSGPCIVQSPTSQLQQQQQQDAAQPAAAEPLHAGGRRGAQQGAQGCTVLCLSRAAFEAALHDVPGALSLLQWAALRSVCLDLISSLDLMERNSTL